jgi:hypothetical protein
MAGHAKENAISLEEQHATWPKNCVNPDEMAYLNQVRQIIQQGSERTDRTATGTRSIFGMQSRYSLRDGNFIFL